MRSNFLENRVMGSSSAYSATLLLADGTVFKGYALGVSGTTTGEICFNTGMTGYQEIFTDPSYYRQLMIMTNAHIGNYGVNPKEQESLTPQISGLVCRNFAGENYSRNLSSESLQSFLASHELTGISGIDTRALVKHVRDKGTMNAIISTENKPLNELKQELSNVPEMDGLELSSKVTTSTPYVIGSNTSTYRVAALDLGIKQTILKQLGERDCQVKVFPGHTDFSTIEEWEPDGYFISNGPGDPSAVSYALGTVQHMLSRQKPFFGICLGHQLFALAKGGETYKMHNGHRGINHPVKNLETGRSEITSQNHGFSVDPDSIERISDLRVTHVNLNDQSIEGLASKSQPAFSVQYHPEASPGPHDARYLLTHFQQLMKAAKPAPA